MSCRLPFRMVLTAFFFFPNVTCPVGPVAPVAPVVPRGPVAPRGPVTPIQPQQSPKCVPQEQPHGKQS